MHIPAYNPFKGVRTPLALFTADLENAPVVGRACTNEPKMLQKPRAIISCEASTIVPEAKINTICYKVNVLTFILQECCHERIRY